MRFLFTALLLLSLSFANINVYEFDNQVDEDRFQSLIRELRCPTCQNQNIADSNSPLAQDLKDLTYNMIMDGRADSEIVNYMVDRYGDFVSYNPPLKSTTVILWFGPAGLLLFVIVMVVIVRAIRRRIPEPVADDLTPEDRAQLNKILGSEDKK